MSSSSPRPFLEGKKRILREHWNSRYVHWHRHCYFLFGLGLSSCDQRSDAMEYRRGTKSQTWHFCRNCSHWPSDSFNIIVSKKLPPDFELCLECVALMDQERRCNPHRPRD